MINPGKRIYALVAILLFCYYSNGQENRIWGTYYGGSSDELSGSHVYSATDASGNVYVAGVTTNTTGIASGGHQNTYGGGGDAFLVKFDANGNRLWATYYGGTLQDYPSNVAVDDSGNVFLAGETRSSSGIASGGFQNSSGGGFDAFLVKFNAAGVRQWGTYYGGSNDDGGWGLSVDHAGNALLTGYAVSTSDIGFGGYQVFHGNPGGYDAFLVKFSPNGARQWATYYGGPGADFGFDVAADAAGNIYLAGQTSSTTTIASGGFQNTAGGAYDAFLVRFNPNGTRQWATYYGGSSDERGASVTIDNTGHPILSGITQSTSGIASGGFQNTYGGGTGGDSFLAKFDSTGARIWSTYYGGTGGEGYAHCCTDASGNIYMAAETNSTNAISSGGFQNSLSGGNEAYLVRFDANGNRLAATYYGGSLNEYGIDVCTDHSGNVYVSGITQSTSGIASGGFQNTFGGGVTDIFLAKFSTCSLAPSAPVAITGTTSICQGTTNTYAIPAVNGAAYYTWTLPGGWTGTSTTTSITATAGTASGTISVTANNSCGASAAQTLVITVIAPAVTSNADTSICAGASVNLSANGASGYIWNPGNLGGSTITILPAATTTYTVTGTDVNGCTGTSTTTITVNALPTVSASATNNPVCAGSFTTLNSGGADTYVWMPGSLNGPSVPVSPAASTTYTVTGTDVNGCADTQTVAITVNPLPNVSYTETQTSICINWNPVTLTPGVPAGGVYSGTAVTGNTFAPAAAGTGTFTITYTYTDINGCQDTATSQVVVDLCTGVAGVDAPGSFELFPNPFQNTFWLNTANGKGTLCVYTMPGEQVYSSQITGEKTEIDLSHLSAGLYMIQLTTSEGTMVKQIIKE